MADALTILLREGSQQLSAGNLDEAWLAAQQLCASHGRSELPWLFAAEVVEAREGVRAAIGFLAQEPSGNTKAQTGILLQKARLLCKIGERRNALTIAEDASKRIARVEYQYRALVQVLIECGEIEKAYLRAEDALKHFPDSAGLNYEAALSAFYLNRVERAEFRLQRVLTLNPASAAAFHLRSIIRRYSDHSNHVAELTQLAGKTSGNKRLFAAICYALAKELEDLGNYKDCVSWLLQGSAAYRSTLNYDVIQEVRSHQEIIATVTRERISHSVRGVGVNGPIFVVGMPRSGTTLVERMLSAHSKVVSVGELRDFPALLSAEIGSLVSKSGSVGTAAEHSLAIDFYKLGEAYSRSARQLVGDAGYFVDKLPYNFQYCGYILRALPNAKIIHLRRNPLDTCYAVFKTLFFGAYNFSYDLAELGEYYISYSRLMAHWHAVCPGQILDVCYEDLVTNPSTETRRLLQWCGLSWEDEVLRFHELEAPAVTASSAQVRAPMHTHSIGSWRRAEQIMLPLQQKLINAGIGC